MTEKILMVVHGEHSRFGRIGDALTQRGYTLERCCPMLGDKLPVDSSPYAGAVVFGGPMSANDCDSLVGIQEELNWIPSFLECGKAFLGICLGAQLLAKAFGAKVSVHPEGAVEIGYYALHPTAQGARHFKRSLKVYHWHKEGFEVPACATLLATGDTFENQAFQVGERAFGIQFHPEVTLSMLQGWTQNPGPSAALPGAQDRATQLAGHRQFDACLGMWLENFIDGWI